MGCDGLYDVINNDDIPELLKNNIHMITINELETDDIIACITNYILKI